MIRRLLRAPALLAFPIALVVGACSEKLDTSAACPVLCPGQELEILDTLIDPAMVLDTTLSGFPLLGLEQGLPMLLASRGDTLDTRIIIRFDSLTRVFRPTAADTLRPIAMIDSSTLQIRLERTGLKVPNRFFIDVYDVTDSTLVDSLPETLLPYFSAPRLIGTRQIDSANFIDSATVKINLDTAWVRDVVTTGKWLRLGLQVRSTESAMFRVSTSDNTADSPRLRYRVSADTAVAAVILAPTSFTPRTPLFVNGDLVDYTLVVRGQDPRATGTFAVGGLPSLRSYLRFAIPRRFTDSVAVLRAQLEFVQSPVYGFDEADSIGVTAQLVLAGHATTDLSRAARLLAPPGYFVGDHIRRLPSDYGIVSLEINTLFRTWRTNAGLPDIPQAIVLRSDLEGSSGAGLRFFGINAPPGLRPRIRVSYVPSIEFGRP